MPKTITTTDEDLQKAIDSAVEEKTKAFKEDISKLEKEKNKALQDREHFTNVKVKSERIYPIGLAALAKMKGWHERKTATEVLAEEYKNNPDQSIKAAIQYMSKSIESADSPQAYNDFMNKAKSVGMGDLASGAGLSDPAADPELVASLRPENKAQSLPGVKQVQLVNGQAKVNVVETGTSAYHVGSTETTESNPTYGQRLLTAKKIAGFSVIDNDRIRLGDLGLQAQVQQELVDGVREEWDRGIIRGGNAAHEPDGFIISAGNSFTRTSSPDATKIGKDLRKAKKQLQDDNIADGGWVWMMRPSLRTSIEDQYNSNKDQMHYASRLENEGTLMGYPVITTNNMPSVDADKVVLLVQPSEIIYATGYGLTLDIDSSKYFDTDKTAIRGVLSYDVAYKHTEGICKIDTVNDWETT